jgi:hypothetical protein
MTVPRSAPGEDSGGSHQPRFRGATDRKYGRHALQCNKESPPGDVAEMLRLRAGAEGRISHAWKVRLVNLKTAKELGITIPPSVLGRAHEVID